MKIEQLYKDIPKRFITIELTKDGKKKIQTPLYKIRDEEQEIAIKKGLGNRDKNNCICYDIHNSKIVIIDVDEKDYIPIFVKDRLYTDSFTMKGKHFPIFLDIDIKGDKIDIFKDFKGDIITRQIFERYDSEVYKDKEIKILKYSDLLPHLKYDITKKKLDVDKIKKLLDCLDDDKVNNYNDWVKIGMMLYNEDSERCFDIWDEWSKKSLKYSKKACIEKWASFDNMQHSKITLGSLHYMAKQDNKDKFTQIQNSKLLLDSLSLADDDISTHFHSIYKNTLVCSQCEPRHIWYNYNDGLWKRLDGKAYIRKLFNKDFKKKYKTFLYDYQQNTKDEGDKKINTIKQLKKIIKKLGSYKEVTTYINQSVSIFYDEEFTNKLNSNRYLLSFGSNVYDLKKCEWRNTKIDDYLSVSVGYSKDEVNSDNLEIVTNILKDIYPDENEYEYSLNNLSMFLCGKNINETFNIWLGTGANGKSLLADFLKYSFGKYYASMPTTLITNKRSGANEANPELAKARYARVAVFSEPEHHSKLNNSLIKEISGGDTLSCRELYGKPFDFSPQFKCIILCNQFELQDCDDDSMSRRLIFIKHKSSFVDKEDLKYNFQKEKVTHYKEEEFLNKVKGSFMYLLIKQWEKISKINYKYKMPKSMKDDKNEFLDDNNLIKTFVKENIEFTDNKDDIVKLCELYTMYNTNAKKLNEKHIKMNTLKRRLQKYLPEFKARYSPQINGVRKKEVRNIFINCKLIQDEDDDNNYGFSCGLDD